MKARRCCCNSPQRTNSPVKDKEVFKAEDHHAVDLDYRAKLTKEVFHPKLPDGARKVKDII